METIGNFVHCVFIMLAPSQPRCCTYQGCYQSRMWQSLPPTVQLGHLPRLEFVFPGLSACEVDGTHRQLSPRLLELVGRNSHELVLTYRSFELIRRSGEHRSKPIKL